MAALFEVKAQKGHNDADACLTAPLVLGVADGVSQIEVGLQVVTHGCGVDVDVVWVLIADSHHIMIFFALFHLKLLDSCVFFH